MLDLFCWIYASLFFDFFEGKWLLSRYLRVTGRWRKLPGRYRSYFDPNPTSWCRVMVKKHFKLQCYTKKIRTGDLRTPWEPSNWVVPSPGPPGAPPGPPGAPPGPLSGWF